MHWLASFFLLFHLAFPTFFSLAPAIAASAEQQPGSEINDLGVNYRFGEQITFQAQVETDSPVQEVMVFLKPAGQQTAWQKMSVEEIEAEGTAGGRSISSAYAAIQAREVRLYPFSNVEYHYEATLGDGSKITSETFQFQYQDNRFPWRTTETESIQVSWYSRDPALGQMILNVAERGLAEAQKYIKADLPRPLRIYGYSSANDLQTALQINNQPWVAGHATPELGMILISIPSGPEQKLELERQIPHELMHILQYQVVGSQYTQQPVWLVEGMASLSELYPNPEYQRVLEKAAAEEMLLPISSLCASFPNEAAGAFLAYAEAESFVRFYNQKYGMSGLRALINQYHNGVGCEEGIFASTGMSMKQIEHRWKQEALGIDTGGLVLRNLSPYLLIGLFLLLPVSLAIIPLVNHKSRRRHMSEDYTYEQ